MTLILAVATDTFGVVCADTRLNIRHADGRWTRNDTGTLEIHRADGSTDVVPPKLRKVRRFSWGWAAAGGSSHLLNSAIFNELEDMSPGSVDEVGTIARSVISAQAESLRAEFKEAPPEDRVGLLFVFDSENKFHLGQVAIGVGGVGQTDKSQFALSFPIGTSSALMKEIYESIASELVIPTDRSGLYEVTRRIAKVFHRAHSELESVGPVLDLAIVARTTEGRLVEFQLHGESLPLANGSDAELSVMLEEVT